MTALVAFLLTTLSVGGFLVAAFLPKLSNNALFEQRFNGIAAVDKHQYRPAAEGEMRGRRRSVEETLKEIEEKQKAKSKNQRRVTLIGRMRQGGLTWSRKSYYLVCVVTGIVVYIGLAIWGVSILVSLGFALSLGLLVPHLYVGRRRNRRFKLFEKEFPNAMDIIVRGLKSGLPMADCLKIIAAEAQEPVRGEFRTIVADQTLGLPLDEAVGRLTERVPLSEANFFAIVVTIQSRTGGSLSEALGNLSRVLRERKKLLAKIKAVSSEAKASAGIIGALPIIVGCLVYLTSPDYISLLFTTFEGKVALGISAFWMSIGVLVMRKMINFDF